MEAAQHYVSTPEDYARRANDVFRRVGEGRLKVAIHHVYPLAEAAEAHRALAARSTSGKLLLGVSGKLEWDGSFDYKAERSRP